jgi:acetylornithine deacetylase/succinyl-diaminopimelate desuccinylase-like protein
VASEGLAGDVYIGLGAGGERAGFIGTAAIVRHLQPDYAIVCEPTSLDIVHVQYGCVWTTFTVRGKQGFVDAGVSALANAMPLYEGLLQLNREINNRQHPKLPPSKLAVNALQSGNTWVLTPDRAVIKVDRRFIPSETIDGVRVEFQDLLDRIKAENPAFDASFEFHLEVPSVEMPTDSAVAGAAAEVIEQVRGAAPQFLGIKGFTEAVHPHLAGVPVVICGPGSTAVIHAVDEWIPESDLYDAVAVYTGIARRIASIQA